MLAAVMALAGVLLGTALTLGTVGYLERKHRHQRAARHAAEDKRAAYRQVLRTLDELFALRPDHPEVGHLVRSLTGQITELQLVAPPELADLAGQCVTVALQPDADPRWATGLRRQFALAARTDLDPRPEPSTTRTMTTRAAPGRARHPVARHAR